MKQPMIYNKGINTIQGNTSFFASFSILSLAGSDNLLTYVSSDSITLN